MKNYIVTYSYKRSDLFSDYDQVQGNTAIEAARKYVNDSTKKIIRSGGRDVNLCLLQGRMEGNRIKYIGNHIWYKVS